MKAFALSCICVLLCTYVCAQDTVSLVGKVSSRYINTIEKKATGVEAQLNKQSHKALERLQKQQQKVHNALRKIDSNAAIEFLNSSRTQYETALTKLKDKGAKVGKLSNSYVPGLDSMNGVLQHLNKLSLTGALPGKEKIGDALSAAANAGQCLDKATEIKKLMQQQEQQLRALEARFKDLHINKQLKQCNKELYYYSQRVQQAKQTMNDPNKIEGELLNLLRKNETFKSWMQQNGQLARLFGAPASSTGVVQSITGLQTRQNVQQMLQSRLGGTLQQSQQLISSQVQQVQSKLNSLSSRLQQLGGRSSTDTEIPNFKPNQEKTKSLLKRVESGWNLQTTQHNGRFPSVNELGLSLGYKLNAKCVIGIGAAYRFGLGQSIRKIQWTNEGVSLRSYIDLKWKGNFWISGGYELTYWQRFDTEQFKNIAWNQSAMIGLSKKIKIKKKNSKVQVLYDFLRPFNNKIGLPLVLRYGFEF